MTNNDKSDLVVKALRQLVEAAENRLDVWTKETYFDLIDAIYNAKKVLKDKP